MFGYVLEGSFCGFSDHLGQIAIIVYVTEIYCTKNLVIYFSNFSLGFMKLLQEVNDSFPSDNQFILNINTYHF